MIQNFFAKSFKAILFAIGLSLTIWRSHECLQKYSNSNLSTKVNMFNSFETVLPVIVICPSYMESYNFTNLKSIGIANAEEYRNGNWYGNSALDGTAVLKYVTRVARLLGLTATAISVQLLFTANSNSDHI